MVPSILALSLWVQAQVPGSPSLPGKVADYSAFLAAQQHSDAGRPKEAIESLRPLWKFQPISPLLGKAAILAARCHEALGEHANALALLRDYAERLPQPEGWLLLARNAEAAGDNAGAAAYHQRIYYGYPVSNEAAEAEAALLRLKETLGDNYPPAMPKTRLERAARLARGGQAAKARTEYALMALEFGGLDRDLARVRAVSDSFSALQALQVTQPEAEAEQLYQMHWTARSARMMEASLAAVDELGRRFPGSTWRMQALISQGNAHLLKNEISAYEPFYKACHVEFPNEPDAAYCHWKLAWSAYIRRKGTALFEEHLRLFPQSNQGGAALYFLGRHKELAAKYPLSYYATLIPRKPLKWNSTEFAAGAQLKDRLERAQILETEGLPEWAEFELQAAARNESNSYAAALALAETASRRGAYHVSIRYIKRYAPGYLGMPLGSAPEQFWKMAFPLPYREALESNSQLRGLDPFTVAALIRQESEFDPQAISRANAYGLTQVLPSTGKLLSRRVGITRFSSSMLFQPEINLKLGTYYLKTLLDQHGGKWEEALASYNAGKRRTEDWKTWAAYREPAEFIETIPFTETRTYIQIVLRNAYIYRQLYGSKASGKG